MVAKKIYFSAAILTIVIIISTIIISWYVLYLKEEEIRNIFSDIKTSLEASNVELLYVSEYLKDGCEILNETRSEITKKLLEVNKKLIEAEKERRVLSPSENRRFKTEQSILYVKYWILTLEMRKKCNFNISTILYFWDAESTECKIQGYVLDSITYEYGNRVLIVPLDYNFDLGIIKIIAKQFNVTTTPTIIVNEKIKFEGLTTKNDIISALQIKNNLIE